MTRLAALLSVVLSAPLFAVAPATYSAAFQDPAATIGQACAMKFTVDGAAEAGARVYVFFSTTAGTSTVRVDGRDVTLPLGEGAWLAARTNVAGALAGLSGVVPPDRALVGAHLHAAIVVVRADGSLFVSARTGGPIIQDAIA